VITNVPSLSTTVTALGTWFPVRRCSKAMAARAILSAVDGFGLLIGPPFGAIVRACYAKKKKPAWSNTLRYLTTPAYSLTSPPDTRPGCSLLSLPTSNMPSVRLQIREKNCKRNSSKCSTCWLGANGLLLKSGDQPTQFLSLLDAWRVLVSPGPTPLHGND
jgi:hypothetical protein